MGSVIMDIILLSIVLFILGVYYYIRFKQTSKKLYIMRQTAKINIMLDMLEIYTLINNITDYKKRNDILKLLMIHYGIENNEMNMKIIEEADKALKNDYENVSYLLNTNLDKYLY